MKQTHLIFLLSCLLYSCNGQSKHDLNVPNQVSVTPNSTNQQFPGTRLFVAVPKGYELVKELIRFQKNENTFFQVFEYPSKPFDIQKIKVGFYDAIKSGKQANAYYQKDFILGKNDALIVYGPDNKPNMEQMVLCFGNNSFTVMAAGEFAKDNIASRDEILKSLLSMYVDTTIAFDASALATSSLDVSNTEFHYAGNMAQTFIYNLAGKGSKLDDDFANAIMVSTFSAFNDPQAIKDFAVSMIDRYKSAGMEIPTFSGKQIKLNGNNAYEITFDGSFKNRPNSVYMVVTGDDKSSALFCGSVYDRREQLMTQIKAIARTLRTK